MSLLDDLDKLLVKESCEFRRALTPKEWIELEIWCNFTFGKDNWFIERNRFMSNKEGSVTLFLLRWS